MKTITSQKPADEVMKYVSKCQKVYIIGCGTCATLCHTGGKSEVLAMKKKLEEAGKEVPGWMIIPTACDELTKYALEAEANVIEKADCILAMTCAVGVQMIALHRPDRAIYPALNTLFIGMEESPGIYKEVCLQCASCVLGRTAAICPLVRCAKSLFNGPCGGSSGGRCEISKDVPCAWQMIYDRLVELGRLDELEEIAPYKDWSVAVTGGPRRIDIEAECAVPQEAKHESRN